MSITHHLDHATLARYAAGDLSEAFAVVVASHLAMCEDCRKAAREAEGMGGALLDELDAVEVNEDAFERLMAGLDANDATPATPSAAPTITGDVPLPLQRYIGAQMDDVNWRVVAPGVRKRAIKTGDTGTSLFMLHIGEGMAMPEHGHGGDEITLILSGAYRDEIGVFGPGDVADLDDHVEHTPKVEPGGPCICLVATEAPTRFKTIIGKLMQPIAGI